MAEPDYVGANVMTQPVYSICPVYVCLHVPEFPSQTLLRLRPELAGLPVAVLAGDPPQEQVCSVNLQAANMGVVHGMTRAELESFPALLAMRRSLSEERAAQLALLEAAGAFTARMEVQPCLPSAFVVVLDMTGSERLFGTPRQVVECVVSTTGALGFAVQFAACSNLPAAVCIAATAHREPVILDVEREEPYLSRLPLGTLGLTEKQADTLALWGLRTLGELAALPEADLVARLGQEGKRLRLLARGRYPHFMVPEEPVFVLEEFIVFDVPESMLDSLLFVLGPMLDQILVRAQHRAYALASVTVKLGLDGGGEHARTIKPALPLSSRETLLKLLHLDLQAHPPPKGVVSVFVQAEPGDRRKMQLGIFAAQLPEASRLDVTLARIAALVGEERVGRVRLLDLHRPDSFVMERFRVPETGAPEMPARHGSALRRCRPPVELAVQQKAGQLAGFWLSGKLYQVSEALGPWRKSGQWWSAEVWSRDEWDVRAEVAGETLLCVISKDLLRNQWQLEALYD